MLLRNHYDVSIPEKIDEKKLILKDCYHPLIEKPVKNSLRIENNMIITGSNASGKSTFLKMIGINFVLADAINVCFAKQFQYYPYQLLTCIHMKDNILSGDSYYVAEIKKLKIICQKCKEDECLILIDEILRGTNEKERVIIAKSIILYLLKSRSLSIITTHDTILAKNFKVDHYCFNDIRISTGMTFDYRIKEGICQIGNAIAIMKQMEFDKEILDFLDD